MMICRNHQRLFCFADACAIRRIADHHVEAAALHNLRERLRPVERPLARHRRVVNQRVAAADVVVQRGQAVILFGGFQPERELRDFHRFAVQIHAEEVVAQHRLFPRFAAEEAKLLGTAQAVEFAVDLLALLHQKIERLRQKCAGTAGRIENRDLFQLLKIRLPESDMAFDAVVARFLFGSRDDPCVVFRRQFRQVVFAEFAPPFRQPAADGLLHDVARDIFRRVKDAFFLAFALLAVERFAANFGAEFFEVADGLLENMA